MGTFYYVRRTDDFLRSVESSSPPPTTSGPQLRAAPKRRNYFVVYGDDGTRIHVPLRYLADTAQIEVTGNCDCTLKGQNYFTVLIINGAKIPPQAVSMATASAGEIAEDATERGYGSQYSKRVQHGIHQKVHPKMAQARRKIGQTGTGIRIKGSTVNKATKAVAKAGAKTVGFALKKAVAGMVSGFISTVIDAVSADEIGYEARHVGRAPNGCQVDFRVTGTKPSKRP